MPITITEVELFLARLDLVHAFETGSHRKDHLEHIVVRSLEPIRQGARVHTERLSFRPAWAPDPSGPLAAELVTLAEGMGLGLPLVTSGGAGDTNATGATGIPTVDGLGPEGSGAHADSERASLASLSDRSARRAAYLG